MPAIIRYHGGKVRMASTIIDLFPERERYCEPFGGGAAVLLAKPRSRIEVYNDLDGDIVNLFQVVRDHPQALARAVTFTPFSREEFALCYEATDDPIERARRTLIRSGMGQGTVGTCWTSGFRAVGAKARDGGVPKDAGRIPAEIWRDIPAEIMRVAERMLGVVIESRDAKEILLEHDSDETLHYIDPPYVHDTRGKWRYRVDMTDADHGDLLDVVRGLRGSVVLSGYPSPIYDAALADWRRIEMAVTGDRQTKRSEVLWCNFDDVMPLFAAQPAGRMAQ